MSPMLQLMMYTARETFIAVRLKSWESPGVFSCSVDAPVNSAELWMCASPVAA